MHDVGKIAIPDSILGKPGRLTAEEFEVMKLHTVRGGELLERIPSSGTTTLMTMPTTSPATTTSGGTDGAIRTA